VDIPADKHIEIALTYIYGIGKTTSNRILKEVGIERHLRARDLTEDQLSRIGAHVEKNYIIEGTLRHERSQNIQRLKNIRCYRGLRHRQGLPVRGQVTQSNARTRKGPRKTVAGKRSVKSLAH
jgi:small subunit ribosomal protein S13